MVPAMVVRKSSRGRQLLEKHINEHGDLRKLAARVGINEKTLGAYWRGARKPLTGEREALRVTLKIPLLSWDEPAAEASETQGAA